MTGDELKQEIMRVAKEGTQKTIRRVSAAGQKLMFDEKTHDMVFKDMLAPQIPIGDKLGNGIADVLLVLFSQSKGMPKGALIPAGAILLLYAAEYLEKTGQPVSDEDIDAGLIGMAIKVNDKFDKNFRARVAQNSGKPLPTEQPEQQPQQAQPPQQPQAQPPQVNAPSGLIGRAA